ncbi:MAG: transglutaminase domain-containing protein [Oscillospiraceae bacterium]|nr:transglutaminase domain-containing protein [Oscillospiraceae bacterium]
MSIKRNLAALAALLTLSAAVLAACGGTEPEATASSEPTSAPVTAPITLPPQTGVPSGSSSDTAAVTSDTGPVTGSATSGTTPAPETTETTPPVSESESSSDGTGETSGPAADPVPLRFELDPYDVSSDAVQLCGEGFLAVWRGLADAYLAYETECYCPDEQTFSALMTLIPSCMPYFSADAVLTYESFDAEAQTVTIYYTSASKEEHDAAYSRFCAAAASFVEGCVYEGDSDFAAAVSVYRSFSSSVRYDLNAEDVSPYTALTARTGISESFAAAYAYLLRQVGVDANLCGGLSRDRSTVHVWTVMRLGGKWYYADPTYENGETAGAGLSYFGTNDAERAEAGYDPSQFSVGAMGAVWASSLDVTGTEFAPLRGCSSFELDRAAGTIRFSAGDAVPQTALLTYFPGGAS